MFKYLGSLVEATGRMTGEVDHRIVQASKAFGSLCSAMFMAHDLNLETKRLVYRSVVLGVLLYSAETWAPMQVLIRKLEWFHRHCVYCIMGVGGLFSGQKPQRILPLPQLAEHFGMRESISHLFVQCSINV